MPKKSSKHVKRKYHKENFLQNIITPIFPKFNISDILQVIIGASVLAVPVGFTEETWKLGESLPWINVIGLLALSILFLAMFSHFHYHRSNVERKWDVYFSRVTLTYAFSFLVVALILTLIQRAPWQTDFYLSIKRIIIVTFPSSMSAAIADTLK
jgi:uncharacterized membrane protein